MLIERDENNKIIGAFTNKQKGKTLVRVDKDDQELIDYLNEDTGVPDYLDANVRRLKGEDLAAPLDAAVSHWLLNQKE